MDESHTFTTQSARARQRSLRPILMVAGAAFLMGGALTYYVGQAIDWSFGSATATLSADEGDTPPLAGASEQEPGASASPVASPTTAQSAADVRQAARRVEQVVQQQGGLDQRLAAMEQRLTRLDLQAQAAAGNASRAEGLLIAFAARRAIERGAPLGYLADQLRLRFGDALPNAVEAVTTLGEQPMTVDRLVARLDGLAPALSHTPPDEGVLPRIGREISEMFVIRSEDTPSPRPQNRLERARLFLESGRVEAAVAEVRNLPNAQKAAGWIEDAERYARAQRGLELLETTAILEPRRLRDGTGNKVEQPSPAAG